MLKGAKMYSIGKTLSKGILAVLCFAAPILVSILIKLIPGMSSTTVDGLILDIVHKFLPYTANLTIGSALIMIINYLKNKNK